MTANGNLVGEASNPVIHEHDTVNEYLHEVEALLTEHDRVVEQLTAAMNGLREFLVGHMASEEASELFQQSPEQSPWLHTCVQRLKDGHQSLRGQLAALADTTAVTAPRLDCADFRTRFHRLAKELRDHETAEIAIWQKAYNIDEGIKD